MYKILSYVIHSGAVKKKNSDAKGLHLIFYSQAQTFAKVLDTDTDGSEEKAITALGILNTMETILNVMEDQKEVCHRNFIFTFI